MNNATAINVGDLDKLGKQRMVVLPLADYERLQEDLEMSRSKLLPGKIAEARGQFAKGEVVTSKQLKSSLGLK